MNKLLKDVKEKEVCRHKGNIKHGDIAKLKWKGSMMIGSIMLPLGNFIART